MKTLLKLALMPCVALVFLASCTKIETTNLGAGLIPDVDNINTFDTTFDVVSNNYIPRDTTRLFYNDLHMAGGVYQDPLFGTSKSSLFFQVLPDNFPFSFTHRDSVVSFDSAVLILSFIGHYNDTLAPVTFNLYPTDTRLQSDTLLTPNYTLSPGIQVARNLFLGSKTVKATQYRDTTFIKRGDSVYRKVNNQLRIPMDYQYARRLFLLATSTNDNLGIKSDTLFKDLWKGFAIEPQGNPNALHYFSLSNRISGVEFYYRTRNGKIDTTSTLLGVNAGCGHAVAFNVERAGSEVLNHLVGDPVKGSDQVFIQNAPNVSAKLTIPNLGKMSNRIIHRAELRVTEIDANQTGPTSQLLTPQVMYLDLADTNNTFKGVPYDMSPFTNYFCYPASGIEYFYFGGLPSLETIDGVRRNVFRFNVSRYIQGVISRKEPYFDFRLSAPYYTYYANCSNSNALIPRNYFRILNTAGTPANLPGNGRVRVAGGNHSNPKLRMQMRIIYSKI